MTRIKKIEGKVGPERPMCSVRIQTPARDTPTQRYRVDAAKRRGRDPDRCPTRSTYVVDGEPMCVGHAGRRAIDIVMEKN